MSNVKLRVSAGHCVECGAQYINDVDKKLCVHCAANDCYHNAMHFSCEVCNCIKKGDIYFPCNKAPICRAIKAKDPAWRNVQALDTVPWQMIKE